VAGSGFSFKGCGVSVSREVKNQGGKNMGVKRGHFTRQTDFALISTIFIPWGSDFT
jgi:hypothetical protein